MLRVAVAGLFMLALVLVPAGCGGKEEDVWAGGQPQVPDGQTDSAPQPTPTPTPTPTPKPSPDQGPLGAKTPIAIAAGAPETPAGAADGMRTAIVADALGQPHISMDKGDSGTVLLFYDKVGGAWSASQFNVAAQYNRSVVWTWAPHMEIDSKDRLWISALSIGSGAPDSGQDIFIREGISVNGLSPLNRHWQNAIAPDFPWEWDSGLVSLDPAYPDQGIGISHNSYWKRFSYDQNAGSLGELEAGQIPGVTGGEKTGFYISKAGSVEHASSGSHGVWHAAGHGHNGWDSHYQNSIRMELKQEPVRFASYNSFPGMGEDYNWPGVCGDNLNAQVAYIATDYRNWASGGTKGIRMNIYNPAINPNEMLFSAEQNLVIDGSGDNKARRFSPSMAAAKYGGVFITWMRADGMVMVKYVGSDGNMLGPEAAVSGGQCPSIAAGPDGNLHLAYRNGGKIQYRLLTVSY